MTVSLSPTAAAAPPLSHCGGFPTTRLRRLRGNPALRDLVRETQLHVHDLVHVLFVRHGRGVKNPVSSMPGVYQLSVDMLEPEIREIQSLGIRSVMLFGIPEHKDEVGSDSYCEHGIVQQAIRAIKQTAPDLLIMSDICFCEYTSHGHCGVVNDRSGRLDVDNDATLELLARQAVCHAEAGADILAPSGNIDGMVSAIRHGLDAHGYQHLPILSYAVKFASGMYGPFREAAEGVPQFGDRSSYQIDPANGEEAMREIEQDLLEGADMLMVKPAHTYLDVIRSVTQRHPEVPVAAYHVSGEYSLIKAAAANGWIDEKRVALEVLTSIKRAGARFIFTYYAKDVAGWLR